MSITSNIVEGFGRQTYKDKIHFYYQAQGSLTELKNQLLLAKDINYLKEPHVHQSFKQITSAHQLLQGLIRKSKSFLKLVNHES
ncbi:MAG: four helix bundle protein [Candidatus Roizmanbacteria bacterium]|nr:MAG: four helix bundle protein [Candidatus Roizmanbacteria bacterium]